MKDKKTVQVTLALDPHLKSLKVLPKDNCSSVWEEVKNWEQEPEGDMGGISQKEEEKNFKAIQ